MINGLSRIPTLRVIPRASAFRYQGRDVDPAQAARELGVRAVVIGRVQQRDDSLSISAELIDTRENRQLWGEQYNRRRADLLAVQHEIARQISENLRLRLSGAERSRLARQATNDPEAYHAYLKGFYHCRRLTREGAERGIGCFRQALALDPDYAPAHAGLAYCYIGLGDWYIPNKEAFPLAEKAARKALELDDSLVEAHTFLAVVSFVYERDWAAAERQFARAIELNPSYPDAHEWYGLMLTAQGRFDAGLAEVRRAVELAPLSAEANHFLGMHHYFARSYDAALAQLQQTLELDPAYFWAEMFSGMCYERQGRFEEAEAAFARARRLTEAAGELPTEILASQAGILALAGRHTEARQALEQLQALSKLRYVPPYDLAFLHLALGDKELALAWLEHAYEDRNWWVPWIQVEPRFDALRDEPRFWTLVGMSHGLLRSGRLGGGPASPSEGSGALHASYLRRWTWRRAQRQ